ncbi:MAG: hypothetical protein HN348_12950, partial [Proteobacteria bacterium]|nr:hypothetical protein [Pseudomonadota bacterium]
MIRPFIEQITGYPGLFLVCAISGIPLPYPEDLPLLYAGVRIQGGEWTWIPTLLAAMSGVYVRDIIAFGIGYFVGGRLLQIQMFKSFIGEKKLE